MQIAEKYLKLKSFISSEEIFATKANIRGTMNVPNQRTLDGKSIQELSKLAFEKVQWEDYLFLTFGITLNNGESVKSGTDVEFNTSHTLDQSKNITKIVTTVGKREEYILQINFFSGEERLCTLGSSDENVKKYGNVCLKD